MLDQCANPKCSIAFDHRHGFFFRLHRACAANQAQANTHTVEHFWLCGGCAGTYTLQFHKEHGASTSLRLMVRNENLLPRVFAAVESRTGGT